MKKIVFFIILLPFILNIRAQNTYVPDDNFEQALIDLGYDTGSLNDSVPTATIAVITYLDIGNKNISDLTGIEDFSALTTLWCYSNQLTSLDISACTSLQYLHCHYNKLADLNLGAIGLQYLSCSNNLLANLNLSENVAITTLHCENNQLSTIDVSKNTNLKDLVCNNNQLVNLNLTSNLLLESLKCSENQISSLDITSNTVLGYLDCSYNQLTALNTRENNLLEKILCRNNLLTSLDIKFNTALKYLVCIYNQLESLYLKNGNNRNMTGGSSWGTGMYATNNPDLFCVEVDNVSECSDYSDWLIDNNASYSEDCGSFCYWMLSETEQNFISVGGSYSVTVTAPLNCIWTAIPDCNWVTITSGISGSGSGVVKFNVAINNTMSERNCTINIADKSFVVTQIGAGCNIELSNTSQDFYSDGGISSVNVIIADGCNWNATSDCDWVTIISGSSGDRNGTINFSVEKNITAFERSGTISVLDQVLTVIQSGVDCFLTLSKTNQLFNSDEGIGSVNVISPTGCDWTTTVNCNWVHITSGANGNGNGTVNFSIDQNNTLSNRNCTITIGGRSFSILQNGAGNPVPMTYIPDDNFEQALIDFGYDSEPLNDSVPTAMINELINLDISSRNISDLTGIEDFIKLISLWCNGNQLRKLDVSACTSLFRLCCQNNKLTDLKVGGNNVIEIIDCSVNQLTNMDFSENIALKSLYCEENKLTELNVSSNINLKVLLCEDNKLTDLDIHNSTNLELLFCFNNQLSNLDLSANTSLKNLNCFSNQLSSLNIGENNVLTRILCYDNQLITLDVSKVRALTYLDCCFNQLESLNLKNGNNYQMTGESIPDNIMNATNNPNLTCIEVDDPVLSRVYLDWYIDATADYSENCNGPETDLIESVCSEIKVYPNPAKENIFIETGDRAVVVQMLDLNGKEILKRIEFTSGQLHLSHLTKGVYVLKIVDKTNVTSRKLIIE